MKIAICSLLIVASFLPVSASAADIQGQVFIVTKGAESIKLGLVTVSAFDHDAIAALVAKKDEDAKALRAYFDAAAQKAFEIAQKAMLENFGKAQKERDAMHLEACRADYLRSFDYYTEGLPPEIAHVKTDADGKFELKGVPPSCVLVALASRHVGDDLEHYAWMVAANGKTSILLSNDNLSNSGGEGSLIHTSVVQSNEIGGEKGLAGLEAIMNSEKESQAREIQYEKDQIKIRESESAARAEEARMAELLRYKENPKLAQAKAVELYPELGVAGSQLNKEFVARMKRYQSEKREFFNDPDWPIRLAKECSESLKANSPAGQ